MSNAPAPSEKTDLPGESAGDATPASSDGTKADNDATASPFPKALKAKKKQQKLAAKLNQDPKEPEDTKQETQESREPGYGEQEALDLGSPKHSEQETQGPRNLQNEGPIPVEEKKSKNRRKREARQAGKLDEGKTAAPDASKPDEGRTAAPAAGKIDDGKPAARDVGKLDGKKKVPARRESGGGKRQAQNPRQPDGAKRPAREAQESADSQQEPPPKKENWQLQKAALREKFPEGWTPRKRLSPDALAGIRALHQQFPEEYTTEVLANKFEVSAEAIRRILKSKWEPQPEEEIERQERWFNRGKRIWSAWAEEGKKPPTKWRKEGITRDPSYHEQRRARSDGLRKLAKTLM